MGQGEEQSTFRHPPYLPTPPLVPRHLRTDSGRRFLPSRRIRHSVHRSASSPDAFVPNRAQYVDASSPRRSRRPRSPGWRDRAWSTTGRGGSLMARGGRCHRPWRTRPAASPMVGPARRRSVCHRRGARGRDPDVHHGRRASRSLGRIAHRTACCHGSAFGARGRCSGYTRPSHAPVDPAAPGLTRRWRRQHPRRRCILPSS